MNKNHLFEKLVITASFLDRNLANRYSDPDSLSVTSSICSLKGMPVTADGQIKIHTDKINEFLGNEIFLKMTYWDFVNSAQICGHVITQRFGDCDTILNCDERYISRFPAIRLSRSPKNFESSRGASFVDDLDQGQQLSSDLGVNVDWSTPYKDTNGVWKPVMKELSNYETFKVRDIDDVCKGQFILVTHPWENWYATLPVTAFSNLKFRTDFIAFTPPPPPYSFLNEQLISVYPNARIILTPNIPAALRHQSSNQEIYLANIGGQFWLDGLNYNVLRGRQVVVIDEGGLHTTYSLKLLEKLNQNQILASAEYAHPNYLLGAVS